MEHERVIAARRELRRIQQELGQNIQPCHSVWLSQVWETSLRIDPDGHGLADLVQSFRELITPMRD